MRKRDLTHFGIKWNPFSPEVPTEALMKSPKTELFCWKVEQQMNEGGFILLIGDPGTGKSVLLRQLDQHLIRLQNVTVGNEFSSSLLHQIYRAAAFRQQFCLVSEIEFVRENQYLTRFCSQPGKIMELGFADPKNSKSSEKPLFFGGFLTIDW